MHIKREIFVISNGHNTEELVLWAESLVQSYHLFSITIIINSNFKSEITYPTNENIKFIFYPSNRIIEPQILLLQVSKFLDIDFIWLITKPNTFENVSLEKSNNIFAPIIIDNQCIGLSFNLKLFGLQKNQLPKILNDMRLCLSLKMQPI